MKNLQEIILCAKKGFPKEFESMIPCTKSDKHDWFINLIGNQTRIRLVDVECKNCKTNLAIALKLFAGSQDHS